MPVSDSTCPVPDRRQEIRHRGWWSQAQCQGPGGAGAWTAAAGRGSDLIVEPLAEPEQALDPVWNTVAAELIGAVRSQDQRRTILLGPRTMNNARFLGELALPEQEPPFAVAGSRCTARKNPSSVSAPHRSRQNGSSPRWKYSAGTPGAPVS